MGNCALQLFTFISGGSRIFKAYNILPEIGDFAVSKAVVELLVDSCALQGRQRVLPLPDPALRQVSQVVFLLIKAAHVRVGASVDQLLQHVPIFDHRASHTA